jgi:hypothetical protein
MFNFAFNTISEAWIMESANGQSHGVYVWLVVLIVFLTIFFTFFTYKLKIKNIRKKIK